MALSKRAAYLKLHFSLGIDSAFKMKVIISFYEDRKHRTRHISLYLLDILNYY